MFMNKEPRGLGCNPVERWIFLSNFETCCLTLFWGPCISGLLIPNLMNKHLDWTGLTLVRHRGVLFGEDLCFHNAYCVQEPGIGNLSFTILFYTLNYTFLFHKNIQFIYFFYSYTSLACNQASNPFSPINLLIN